MLFKIVFKSFMASLAKPFFIIIQDHKYRFLDKKKMMYHALLLYFFYMHKPKTGITLQLWFTNAPSIVDASRLKDLIFWSLAIVFAAFLWKPESL